MLSTSMILDRQLTLKVTARCNWWLVLYHGQWCYGEAWDGMILFYRIILGLSWDQVILWDYFLTGYGVRYTIAHYPTLKQHHL